MKISQLKKFPVLLAVLFSATACLAQDVYPSRPITVVVPFPPASTSDIALRAVAQKMSEILSKPVIVENRPGANGQIGNLYVARSKPDGYTLVAGSAATLTVGAAFAKNLPYNVEKDFAPVSLIGVIAPMLVVNKNLPAQTIDELVILAKASPGKLNYGVSSQTSRLLGEIFKLSTDSHIVDIAYKGPAEVALDLLAGRIHISFEAPGAVMPHIRAGTLKPLAVMGTIRSSTLPNVPTVREAGFKGLELEGFIGLLAPAGTAKHIVEKLSSAMAASLTSSEIRAQLETMGMEPRASTPAQFSEKISNDYNRLSAVIKAAGIEPQ